MRRVLTSLIISCSLASTLSAQTERNDTTVRDTRSLNEIVVTEEARRSDIRSSAPTHTIGKGQLLRQGITDIADAMNRLPGITLRDYGGAGGMKTASVRSFGAQHTGVCYDGIMLSECQSGQIDISRYSLDNVEYISLTIGDNDDIFIPARNASTPAVLNIQTMRPPTADRTPHATAQVKIGSFGYVSPFMKYEQSLSEKFAFSLSGEYTHADNNYPFKLRNMAITTTERRANSGMESGHGEMSFILTPNNHDQIRGKLYYYDNDRSLPGQVRYYTNVSKETSRERNFFTQLQYKTHDEKHLSFMLNAKYNWAASKYRDGGYKDGIMDADYWQREFYTSASLLYAPADKVTLDYSADYGFNNLNSSLATDTRPYRHSVLQSLTAKLSTGRLTVIGRLLHSLYFNGAKLGDGARDARRMSPSMSLSYKLLRNQDLYARLSYKNIFRVATFNESYFFHYGSTDLSPENTNQLNLGLTWLRKYGEGSSARITIDGYVNHVTDKIVAVPYNMFIWTNINVGKVKVVGLDATANVNHRLNARHNVSLAMNYSLQKAENRTSAESPYNGYQIAYTPKHSGSASVSYENPWVNITVHGTGTSKRYSNNEHYQDSEIKGYMELGLTLYRDFRLKNGELGLRADLKNALNHQYELVKAYPMPGRSYQLSINYKF